MYEFSVAAKYLRPRWRQLSVSIISLISLFVIAAVVWLVVVFFSISNGLTDSWIDKLVALTAPVRITPTEAYFNSYYHRIDEISAAANFTTKSIGEKLASESTDPYNPEWDVEIPSHWLPADRQSTGQLRDPVKEAFAAIATLPGVTASDYEVGVANLNLLKHILRSTSPSNIVQPSFIGSLDPNNGKLLEATVSVTPADLMNILTNLPYDASEFIDGDMRLPAKASQKIIQSRLEAFFKAVKIQTLSAPLKGWQIPIEQLPANGYWDALLVTKAKHPVAWVAKDRADIPKLRLRLAQLGIETESIKIKLAGSSSVAISDDGATSIPLPALKLNEGIILNATLVPSSLATASSVSAIQFDVQASVQGVLLTAQTAFKELNIEKWAVRDPSLAQSFWVSRSPARVDSISLPSITGIGEGVLLPKSYRESGVLIGDRGSLSYYDLTASSLQEQHEPIFVAGFYDPGIIPIGGKYIVASKALTSLIQGFANSKDISAKNGINIRFANNDDAGNIKKRLESLFDDAGISQYWKIETFREYEFTRDILQQLQSDKRLFTLLAAVIIIVACSNIISMLIILVNDKKIEIGILRSMGASSFSIATIFAFCGAIMGTAGSLIGTALALLTLKNIQTLVDAISYLQGQEMFNPMFYGESLPTSISAEALIFVSIATCIVSIIAAIVPAIKASLLRPTAILRSE